MVVTVYVIDSYPHKSNTIHAALTWDTVFITDEEILDEETHIYDH